MSDCPETEEIKASAIKFDLANLELELNGILDKLKGDVKALTCFHETLSNALRNCEEAIADADQPVKAEARRIPHD